MLILKISKFHTKQRYLNLPAKNAPPLSTPKYKRLQNQKKGKLITPCLNMNNLIDRQRLIDLKSIKH